MKKFSICTQFFKDTTKNVDDLYECIKLQKVDWEWVVTDDFSEDDTVMKYLIDLSKKDRRVRYVTQSHKMEFLRNPSLFAKGEYVFHIDSDDLVLPGYLEQCQRIFERFPEVGVILATGRYVNQDGLFRGYVQHQDNCISFLGRTWRNSIEINLSEILEDEFFTTSNDLFLVKYLNTKTKMIVLPRTYIQYRSFEIQGQYKAFGERMEVNNTHLEKNQESLSQFSKFYEENKQKYDGIFPVYEGIDKLTKALYPVHMFECDKINFLGFNLKSWQMSLLEELYFDKEIFYSHESRADSVNILCQSFPVVIEEGLKYIAFFDVDEINYQCHSNMGANYFISIPVASNANWQWVMKF
jgi:glycosyltransferase involved in cell wall biosynthesis